MFERYTERARRVLFFARYEATNYGSTAIDTEHLLLGLLRDGKGVAIRLLQHFNVSLEDVRRDLEGRFAFHEKIPVSQEIPFTPAAKRTLQYTAEEADRHGVSYIGVEHLLLGLLRADTSVAAQMLTARGMQIDAVRKEMKRMLEGGLPPESERLAQAEAHVELIKLLVKSLGQTTAGTPEATALVEQITAALEGLKGYFAR
jgi:ATP-dependent Clp protease ATP-binding subunit ClpC